ncbi:MAG: peptidase S1 [Sandaracinus sp.]|nr:peptidase S1 [Sandaracinus sp.]
MKKITKLHAALALAAAVGVLGFHGESIAQSTLRIGGSSANYGVHNIRGGFVPDPKQISVVSGGGLNAASMGYGAGCTGWVTAQPDAIVNYANPGDFLRFFVRASGDTTLVINDARGRWHCNDDAPGGGTNPMVTLENPSSGQHDVWIGSYEQGQTVRGTLYVTELRSETP